MTIKHTDKAMGVVCWGWVCWGKSGKSSQRRFYTVSRNSEAHKGGILSRGPKYTKARGLGEDWSFWENWA